MLLIWDIHITSKNKDRILQHLHEYIFASDDTEILFLWDYVYHFNYDRKALMWLFELFVACFEKGKQVSILAWNHDWLSGHFVYEEAQRAFSYLQWSDWSLDFITEPVFKTIQWQECLFFPYHIPAQDIAILPEYQELADSSNQKEQWSARVNSLLSTMITQWKGTKVSDVLRVFHHWYIVETSFPGQFAKFAYKNPGLSASFFDDADIRLCSGHLHQPFCYKNYLCLGSVWHTSPLEINQTKFLFSLDVNTQQIQATPIYTNPYYQLALSWDQSVSVSDIHTHITQTYQENISHLQAGNITIDVPSDPGDVPLGQCVITVQAEVSYQDIETIIPEDVFAQVADVRIKRSKRQLPEVLELLDTQSKELGTRISDWKSLLTSYLDQKYWEESKRYTQELHEIWVL